MGREFRQQNGPRRRLRMRWLVGLLLLAAAAVATAFAASHLVAEAPSPYEDRESLRLVHVIFRHGERTPADTYPTDKYINHTFYPYGWGQLTNQGRLHQFNTGKFLRQRYDRLLGKLYTSPIFFAQSTESDRAYMSCALTLAGLWPTEGTDLNWNSNLNWSPIPIKVESLDEDSLLLVRKSCPRYYEELENVFNSSFVENLLKENDELLKELSYITGMSIHTPDDVQSLYNTLLAEKEYGLQLPTWTEDFYPEKLIPLTEISFVLNAYNDELKRLKGGPLLKKIISDWKNKSEGTLTPYQRKMFLYSGHDSTVANLMLALKVWDTQIPVYGIMILLELHENIETEGFGVEIYLRNSSLANPVQLTIPGCTSRCPLDKVIELTKSTVPNDWEKECKPKNPEFEPPPPSGP